MGVNGSSSTRSRDLSFVPGPNDDPHDLLAVTEKMTIWKLIEQLRWVADRMAVMCDARRVL